VAESSLRDRFERGLAAPICLTWELTYACNLACTHCLSSSGRRDPRELTTSEAKGLIDEIAAMQIFYVNIGGGEPMMRRDFFELIEHAVAQHVGVKFSTNGTRIDRTAAQRLANIDYLDLQVSSMGPTRLPAIAFAERVVTTALVERWTICATRTLDRSRSRLS
jgi:MoaA/NifB/PqqE/SkfB family radical SAM enzyme